MKKKTAAVVGEFNPQIDWFFDKAGRWKEEYGKLREIAISCGLTEGLKWGQPCYVSGDSNIVVIHGFKEYCAYLFFKGALMKDPKGILIQQTPNVQVPRQARFTSAREIVKLAPVLKAYIQEAIQVERSGAKVKLKTTADHKVPGEFQKALDKDAALRKAYGALTPGRQRGYLFYFNQAKQSKTREDRVAKCVPAILKGKGFNE